MMRAACLHEYHRPPDVGERPTPEPEPYDKLRAGEVTGRAVLVP